MTDTTRVSPGAGGFALQPQQITIPPKRATAINLSDMSIHHMQCERHAPVTFTAEDRAVSHEVSRLVRGECRFRIYAFMNLQIDSQIIEVEPMRDIAAFENKNYRLPFLHSERIRLKEEPVGSDLNPAGLISCALSWNHPDH